MDKVKGRFMIRKAALFFVLSVFLILIGGCETIKGAFEGAKKDWQAAQRVDDWIQDNLW